MIALFQEPAAVDQYNQQSKRDKIAEFSHDFFSCYALNKNLRITLHCFNVLSAGLEAWSRSGLNFFKYQSFIAGYFSKLILKKN